MLLEIAFTKNRLINSPGPAYWWLPQNRSETSSAAIRRLQSDLRFRPVPMAAGTRGVIISHCSARLLCESAQAAFCSGFGYSYCSGFGFAIGIGFIRLVVPSHPIPSHIIRSHPIPSALFPAGGCHGLDNSCSRHPGRMSDRRAGGRTGA